MASGIYVWKLNGIPKYVGQGKNVERRMCKKHYNSTILLRAVEKYGFDAFEKEIICYCDPNEMEELETYYIKALKTHHSQGGYNISWGGKTPMLNRKHSLEAKEKMSKARTGVPCPERAKELNRARMINSPLSLGVKKGSSSKYRGVSKTKRNKNNTYWIASLTANRKTKRIGYFKTELEAAQAYDNFIMSNGLNRPLNFSY